MIKSAHRTWQIHGPKFKITDFKRVDTCCNFCFATVSPGDNSRHSLSDKL